MKSFRVFLILFAVWLSGSALAQGWAVTPGEGVGAVTLGMTTGQASAVLTPTDTIGPSSNPVFIKYGEELLINYEGGKAVMISLHKNTFKSKSGAVSWVPYKGVAIGSVWNAVKGQLPGMAKSHQIKTAKGYPEEFYYAYLNLGFGVRTKGGKVDQVDVWARK